MKPKKCLLCKKSVKARGVCGAHLQAFYRALKKRPAKERKKFEDLQVASKRILKSHTSRVNPFN